MTDKKTNENFSVDSSMIEAADVIKQAILRSQHKVASKANGELLSLYYGIGKYISEHTRKNSWGTGAIESISQQLQHEIPGLRGFSAAAIRKMRIFYEQWCNVLNHSLTVNDLETTSQLIGTDTLVNHSLAVNETNWDTFLSLSFTHHYEILAKTETVEERLFYINKAVENLWSKEKLIEEIKVDLYHHQAALPNNFNKTITPKVSALKAMNMFKDNYLLDFVNMEELGAREKDLDERVLEQEIVHNIKNFIMTFGKDFTFVGNQYHLEKYGEELFPDLLFYNREIAALVVVELKMGSFKPSYLGQLAAYLRVLDDEVKKPFENPSIGIILCKNANKSFVEYLIQGYDNPMGVATFKTADEVKRLLPNEEELLKLLGKNENED